MANYKGIANTEYGKEMRSKIKWVKKSGTDRSFHTLYLGNKRVGEVTNSTFSGMWFYYVDHPVIGGSGSDQGYARSFQDAKKMVLKYSGLSQFYKH